VNAVGAIPCHPLPSISGSPSQHHHQNLSLFSLLLTLFLPICTFFLFHFYPQGFTDSLPSRLTLSSKESILIFFHGSFSRSPKPFRASRARLCSVFLLQATEAPPKPGFYKRTLPPSPSKFLPRKIFDRLRETQPRAARFYLPADLA
jgi:hypothetical protein